jgi:hypothetical protein
MAESQWVEFDVFANGITVGIQNANTTWGKFYFPPRKKTVNASEINKIVIPPGGQTAFGACGNSNSWSGTEGQFDLFDVQSSQKVKIGTLYWNVPFGSNTNSFQFTAASSLYLTEVTGGNMKGGALGTLVIASGKRTQ